MSNSDLSGAIAQGLQQEAITLAERLAARTDEPGLRRAAELLAIVAALPTVDLRPHLEWALRRISTSLGEGEHYTAALHALEEAQQPAAVAPTAGYSDIFQVGYWLSHQQLRPAGSFDINPLCDELKSEGWSEAPVFVGMPTLQVTLARGNEGDLAALVKRLARALRKAKPGNEMCDQAMDYLKRQGLLGSPLRDAAVLDVPAALAPERWCPDVCPITGRPFFMWVKHHETGEEVPTYGGPFDSYTLPIKGSDGSFERECYDHDEGWWRAEKDCLGVKLVDDQSFVVAPAHPRYTEIEAFAAAASLALAAPSGDIEVHLNEALSYVQRIAQTESVSLAPTFHNEVRRPNDRRKYTMSDARRDACNAVSALEKAFDAVIEATRAAPAAPAVDASDTDLLDAMTQHRIGLLPEYGGSWGAEIYLEGACAQHIGNGATPRETLRAALAAMVIEGGAA